MKRLSILLAIVASLVIAGSAMAAPKGNVLTAFGTGVVTISGNGATIVNDPGEYGGVYIKGSKTVTRGALLANVDFSFTSTGEVAGGAPRFSIPIDTNGSLGTAEGYAFIDAANCGGTSNTTVLVSTTEANCQVFFQGVAYPNWDAFASANPTYRISNDPVFIIADVAGNYDVTDIDLS